MEVSNLLNARFGKFLGIFVWWWNVEANGGYEALSTGAVTHSPPRPAAVVQQHTLLALHNTYLHTHIDNLL